MRVPLSWLRDLAAFDLAPEELGRTFDELGMVVEGIERVGEGLEGVVVGRVLEVAPIEGARVRRTRVDLGDLHGRDVQIVCGAPNVEAGQLVPVAVVGAVLPGDFRIGKRKVVGVESNGMICSQRELAIGDEAGGIMVLPDGIAEPGTAFGTAAGIEPDVVFDLAIETNRPDAMCVVGVARDAAARLRLPFEEPAPPPLPDLPAATASAVGCPELAPRFATVVLEGAAVGPSPAWLQRRLVLAGMRPISNLVDISNYVMLELGQPTHPYDLDRLPGGGLGVRVAAPGEVLTTLDDVERRLGGGPSPDVVITDGEGAPVGIAGIMGGASSEVHEGTTRVLLEAAHFDRLTIAKTSKRLGLRSEASARFERGVDPLGIERAVARYVELAAEVAGARPVAWSLVESPAHVPVRRPIRVRTERVNGLLGTELDDARIAALLAPIGFRAEPVAPGVQDVTPPSPRLDAELEVDVVEEVARHLGYAEIARTVPRPRQVGRLSEHQRERRAVREVLVGLGVFEAPGGLLLAPGDHARAGLPALEEGALVADSPLVREESVLRRSLRPGLLRAVQFNLDRRAERAWLFEVGTTFEPADGSRPAGRVAAERWLPDEREVVALATGGDGGGAASAVRAWWALAEALRLEQPSLRASEAEPGLHPSRTAEVLDAAGARLGVVGEVDPDVAAGLGVGGRVGLLELDLARLLAAPRRSPEAQAVSRFPSSDLDLAFVVPDEVPAGEVLATLRSAAAPLAERVHLFDVYRGAGVGEGSRSLAFRLRLSSLERTLGEAELADRRQRCIDAVVAAHGATLR